MNGRIIFIVCLLALLVTGCGSDSYWYRDGAAFEKCKRDNDECSYMAQRKYSNWWTLDQGFRYEEYMKDCMESRGYKLYKLENLPLSVKRIDIMHFGAMNTPVGNGWAGE